MNQGPYETHRVAVQESLKKYVNEKYLEDQYVKQAYNCIRHM